MRVLRVLMRPCPRFPPDAVAHLGFGIRRGAIVHAVYTRGGVKYISARCDECVLYRLLQSCVVHPRVAVRRGLLVVTVADSRAARSVLRELGWRVVKVEEADARALVVTERQRRVLEALADGHNISTLARAEGVSKTAVLKAFKAALRKVAQAV